MKVKPVILIFIRNFKIFADIFPKRIKVVLRCELYAVLAVLFGTTLELVGYSLLHCPYPSSKTFDAGILSSTL